MSKPSQQVQDEIFRKMTADKKLIVGSDLWKLGKELGGEKVDYGRVRSETSTRQDRKDS